MQVKLHCVSDHSLCVQRMWVRMRLDAEIQGLIAAAGRDPALSGRRAGHGLRRWHGHCERARRPRRRRRGLPDRAALARPAASVRRARRVAGGDRGLRRRRRAAGPLRGAERDRARRPGGTRPRARDGATEPALARPGARRHGAPDRRRPASARGCASLSHPGPRHSGRAQTRPRPAAVPGRARAGPVHPLLRGAAHRHLRRLRRGQVDASVDDRRRHRGRSAGDRADRRARPRTARLSRAHARAPRAARAAWWWSPPRTSRRCCAGAPPTSR